MRYGEALEGLGRELDDATGQRFADAQPDEPTSDDFYESPRRSRHLADRGAQY